MPPLPKGRGTKRSLVEGYYCKFPAKKLTIQYIRIITLASSINLLLTERISPLSLRDISPLGKGSFGWCGQFRGVRSKESFGWCGQEYFSEF